MHAWLCRLKTLLAWLFPNGNTCTLVIGRREKGTGNARGGR
jgi:hypothetical protein